MTNTQTCFDAIKNALTAIDTLTSELTMQAINDPDILRDPPTVAAFRKAVGDTVIDFLTGPRMTELRGNARTIDMTHTLVNEVVFKVRADKNNPGVLTDGPKTKATCAPRSDLILDEFTSATPPSVLAVAYQLINEKPLGIQDAIMRNAKNAVTSFGLRTMANAMIAVCQDQRDRVTGREFLRFWKPRIALLEKVASRDEFSDKHDKPRGGK